MGSLTLLTAAIATSAAPARTAPTSAITTVTVANIVDGEYFVVFTPKFGDWRFVFDKDGDYEAPRPYGCIKVSLVGLTTADHVRDAIITAINAANIGVVASSGGAATVTLTMAFPVVFAGGNYDAVANATFAITAWSGGALSGVALRPPNAPHGQGLGNGDEAILELWSSAGSGTMTVTVRLWGYCDDTQEWGPLGVGADTTKGTINGEAAIGETVAAVDKIQHKEIVVGLLHLSRIYAQVTAIGGTNTAISARLTARDTAVLP